MDRRTFHIFTLSLCTLLSVWWAADAQDLTDSNPAVNNPDKFAWDRFVEINGPAIEGRRGVPDPNKKIGDSGLRVWQTWKTSSENGSEVFLPKGRPPKDWDEPQAKDLSGELRMFLSLPKMLTIIGDTTGGEASVAALLKASPILSNGNQEARINRVGFEYIVHERLYSLDGQERFRDSGRTVEFPPGTINVKATWREFTPEEVKTGVPSSYYTAEEGEKVWGLTGFHMTTKDLKNWFWATFEQVDNPPPEIADRDRYTKLRYPASAKVSFSDHRLREIPDPLKNTVFQYYVLRGTQTNFIDSTGSPTVLGNTQLEGGMQTSASCISCHARATIGDRLSLRPGTYLYPDGRISNDGSNRLTVNPGQVIWQQDPQDPKSPISVLVMGALGAPRPEWFIDSAGRSRYTQLDFLWGFIHAQREP
jgi:hypothetical protein